MLVNLPSRAELLLWVSDLTKTKVQKIEQLSDGIHFCQIFDHIYPKVINLNKLKRDTKNNLEREKNFKVLQNAVDQLDLRVAMNITDLGMGKVTSMLELLQWMWKEYQKPSFNKDKNEGKDIRESGIKVLKSYVGKLIPRPNHLSLARDNQKSEITKSVGSGRSLDARLSSIPRTQKSDGKSVKTAIVQIQSNQHKNSKIEEVQSSNKDLSGKKPQSGKGILSENKELKGKNLDVSQTKDLTVFVQHSEKKQVQSEKEQKRSHSSTINPKTWIFNTDPESLNKISEEKKENFKRMKAQKDARKDRPIDMSEVMESTLSLNREKLCQKLIKVTAAVLESNPELESKMKKLLASSEKKEKHNNIFENKSQSNENEIIDSSNHNEWQCQNDRDLNQDVEIDRPLTGHAEQNQRNQIVVEPPKNKFFFSNYEANPERKEAMEKFMNQQKEPVPHRQVVLPPQIIKGIEEQKDRIKIHHCEEKIEKTEENPIGQNMNASKVQRPSNTFQRQLFVGTPFFTQKKNEPNANMAMSKKQIHSEPIAHRFNNANQNKESQNQEKSQKEDKPAQVFNTDDEKTEDEVKYPELESFRSVHEPRSSTNFRFI